MMWGVTVLPKDTEKWSQPGYRHTPPYISSTPTIRSFVLRKDQTHTLILASDGLRAVLEKKNVPPDARAIGEAIFALSGFRDSAAQKELEASLGHSLASPQGNLAEVTIQNALFGKDEALLAREMDTNVDIYRDDISVVVVQFK